MGKKAEREEGFEIRPALKAHILLLESLFNEGDEFHAKLLPSHFQASRSGRSGKSLLPLLDEETNLLLIALKRARAVGFLHGRFSATPANPNLVPKSILIIEAIVVTRSERRSGIGKALVREAESRARERKADRMTLNVFSRNKGAIGFYRSLGFEPLSVKMERDLPRKMDIGPEAGVRGS
jgi:ribosomal protein S18 acetylase RimI-like enzyme